MFSSLIRFGVTVLATWAGFCCPVCGADRLGEMDLTVIDAVTKEPIAVRMRMQDSRGRSPRIRNVPRQGDDFTFKNLLSFKIKTGKYQFTMDRGPHYHQRKGVLEVDRNGFDQKTVTLPRFVDMRKEGWYGGDLLVERKPGDLELLADAEELDVLVLPTWEAGVAFTDFQAQRSRERKQTDSGAIVDLTTGLASSGGGRLLAFDMPLTNLQPETIPKDAFGFAVYVRDHGGRICVLDPHAWDLPLLLANDLVSTFTVLSDALQLEGDTTVRGGRQINDGRFRGQHGQGRYAQQIYFHILNCGFRMAPAAFSGSGGNNNPPGYNRVYVACGQDFSDSTWWENLTRGRSVVSNGPVLRVRANDQLPGAVFQEAAGGMVELTLSCNLGTRQKVEYLEIVKNGLVQESVRLDKWVAAKGRLPKIQFKESGWVAIRAYAPGEANYRVALSAPFYVEIVGQRRVSARSAKFFLDWIYDRGRQIRNSQLNATRKRQMLLELRKARDYWQDKLDNANAK